MDGAAALFARTALDAEGSAHFPNALGVADVAPLLTAPGAHAMGRIAEPDVAAVVDHCSTVTCPARAGDIWAYATPILHASDAAHRPRRRRVLQVDFSADPLPGGLEWLGV